MCVTRNSTAMRGISSKAVSIGPALSKARLKSWPAASRLSQAANTVATSAGLGNSLSEAAVMTPSVPSEPISRLLRS